jgi:hypothetical protein
MLGEINTEISKAIKLLSLTEDDIKLIDSKEGESIYKDCLKHFVKSGDRRWWWEDFKEPYFIFPKVDQPFNHLNDILPDTTEKVWLMVEDILEPFYPIYDVKARLIQSIIAECIGFEYYIIAKDKEWLICETHCNELIGIGEKLKNKLS